MSSSSEVCDTERNPQEKLKVDVGDVTRIEEESHTLLGQREIF